MELRWEEEHCEGGVCNRDESGELTREDSKDSVIHLPESGSTVAPGDSR